jgi:hypothetical protein
VPPRTDIRWGDSPSVILPAALSVPPGSFAVTFTEGSPRLQHFAEITASLAKLDTAEPSR